MVGVQLFQMVMMMMKTKELKLNLYVIQPPQNLLLSLVMPLMCVTTMLVMWLKAKAHQQCWVGGDSSFNQRTI